jgi:Tol biopolymer transport system component
VSAPAPVLAPNPNLVVQGIPPIPQSLVQQVAKYTDFRGHAFVDWHPTRREMLVAHRKAGGNTAQLFRIASPLAEPEQLTDFADPVTAARYEPRDGRYIVFQRSAGGSEADQVYRLDLDSRQVALLTEPSERHAVEEWMHHSAQLLVSSMPLDRTAEGGRRTTVTQTLTLLDPAQPTQRRRLAELQGTGWNVGGVSWDDKQIALTRFISANESQVWLLDVASGRLTQVLPAPSAMSGASSSPSASRATTAASTSCATVTASSASSCSTASRTGAGRASPGTSRGTSAAAPSPRTAS